VNTPDKPDPARGWLHIEKLLALDETERLEKLSDADFEDEMRAKGRDPARVPSAADLLARATERARKREASDKPPARVVPLRSPRVRPVWWIAAALALLILAVLATQGAAIIARFKGDSIRPDDDWRPRRPPPHEVAEKTRDEALGACERALWGLCEQKLDDARAIDPAGESEERVQKARRDIQNSVNREAGPPDKPPRP
jgi:hypothetical protein